MFKWVFSLIILMLGLTIGLHLYLQPNDLGFCQTKPDVTSDKCRAAEAIVAISGGDTNARTDRAIELYKNGWASRIIFSGAAVDKSGPSNARAMKTRALEEGVLAEHILMDEYSNNTTENAKNSSEIFKKNNITNVILVTSGYHQRRASLEFSQKAPEVLVRNAPVLSDKNWGMMWWLNPYNWWLASGETVKIIIFYLMGGRV